MWRGVRSSYWLYAVGVAAMIGVYVYASLERRPQDPRPSVAPADVPAALAELATRDDVNVLFILVDTLRAHRLHLYGYERETSPMLDHLAATGVRFARHRAQSSWTKCSMASLWTGLYPVRTGVLRYGHALTEEARLPAEILREAGFRTAGLWRNGWVAPNFGFAQGFEVYHRPRPTPLPPSVRRENPAIRLEGSDVDILESAREFLRLHGQERWLLYLHMMDVHQYVYSKESALFGTGYSDIYDNSIRYVDGVIRALMGELFRRGLLESTLVVVASDHGEAFGEHGLEGHARDLYAEVTEVPFLLSFPFQIESPGLTVTSMTENVDIWPTLLDMLDLSPLEDADGRSLLPLIVAAARSEHHEGAKQSTFAQLDQTWGRTRAEPRPLVTVTGAGHRLIYPSKDPERAELYQLMGDPTERRNIAGEKPEMVTRLRARADDYLASRPAPWGEAPSVELDDMMLNQLRALGYKVD